MKILVISDTHGKIDNAISAIEEIYKGCIDMIIHCGDYVTDARLIEKRYPNIKMYYVYGNCDTGFGGSNYEVVEADGVNIFITHGHRYGVKWGEYDDVANDAASLDCEIAICGHSHIAHMGNEDGVWTMNPGSITLPRDSKYPSYGILNIVDGELLEMSIWQLKDGENAVLHPINNQL